MSPLNTGSNPPNLQAFILDPHVLKTPQWLRNYSCCFLHQCWDALPGLYKYIQISCGIHFLSHYVLLFGEKTKWQAGICCPNSPTNWSPTVLVGKKDVYVYRERERKNSAADAEQWLACFYLTLDQCWSQSFGLSVAGYACYKLYLHITYLHFSNCQDDFMESNLDSKSGPFRKLNSTLILWMEATPPTLTPLCQDGQQCFSSDELQSSIDLFKMRQKLQSIYLWRSHPPSFRKTIWHHLGLFGALNEIYWFPKRLVMGL